MRIRTWLSMGLLTIACLPLGGCPQRIRIPVEFSLEGGLGTFEVQAGVPKSNHGPYNYTGQRINVGSGSVTIDLDDITVTPADGGGGKGTVNLQGGTLTVTAWIAPADEVDTVCETGEEHGPFSVELDENNQPVSIDPSSVPLSENTLDLINGGTFSLCIEVVSPIDGTVTIDALSFSLGL